MRTAFVEALCELAARDRRVMLLTADLGWSVLERFAQRFPDRFFNVGVAEQNMLGIAAGLAREGAVPFVYSIATFAILRCYEQLRNGAVLHQLPVRVVGIGGGYSYGVAGPTHHALEDLTIGRTQPGLTVIAPGDGAQTRAVIAATAGMPGPVYLRVDKNDGPALPGLDGPFALDAPAVVSPGSDILLLATGSIASVALQAARLLQAQRQFVAVAVQAHLPFAAGPALTEYLAQFARVVTIEEGYISGGLGSLVAEAIARAGLAVRLTTLGVDRAFPATVGSSDFLRARQGLTPEGVVAAVTASPVRRVA